MLGTSFLASICWVSSKGLHFWVDDDKMDKYFLWMNKREMDQLQHTVLLFKKNIGENIFPAHLC